MFRSLFLLPSSARTVFGCICRQKTSKAASAAEPKKRASSARRTKILSETPEDAKKPRKSAKKTAIPVATLYESAVVDAAAGARRRSRALPVVLSVDVGTRNFAFCRMDAAYRVLNWGVWDLHSGVAGVVGPSASGPTIHTIRVLTLSAMFRDSDQVVIESQLRGKMKTIEAYLHAFLYEKASVVRPSSVKKHFGTSGGTYRSNKQQAVQHCESVLDNADARTFFAQAKKKDDLADAYLMARFAQDKLKEDSKKRANNE